MIYLDNAATTEIDPVVLDEMMPYLTEEYGNAGGLYDLGFKAKKAIERAREKVAAFVGAESPDQIIFTSGGTESNNTVFHSYGMIGDRSRGIVVSSIEHDSVLRPAEFLKTKFGFGLTHVKPDCLGRVAINDFKKILDAENVGFVSIMYMNNEIGSINDIGALVDVCKGRDILFHSDFVQAAGCIDIRANDLGVDFASISSHKIHGPKGVGALYVKDKDNLVPMILGGGAQEYGFRGGTENVAGLVGFGKACELAYDYIKPGNYYTSVTSMKRTFWSTLVRRLEECRKGHVVHDNAASSIFYGKTLNVRFDGVDAEALVVLLGTKGVYVSAGSACTSHEQKASHVLTGIGLPDETARESIRISVSKFNTLQEMEEAATTVADSVVELLGN